MSENLHTAILHTNMKLDDPMVQINLCQKYNGREKMLKIKKKIGYPHLIPAFRIN